jgi:hypothetical protein
MFLSTVAINPREVELQKLLTDLRIQDWIEEDIFKFKWWFLLLFFCLSGFVWWKMVDKARLSEISLYMAITSIVTLGLDEYGEELTLWWYTIDILPIFPPLTAVDLASLPIIYSLVYQRYRSWTSFLWATVIMSAIFAFVLEPILVYTKFYVLLKWKYYYSFPIYIVMAVLIKWVVEKIKFKEAPQRSQG